MQMRSFKVLFGKCTGNCEKAKAQKLQTCKSELEFRTGVCDPAELRSLQMEWMQDRFNRDLEASAYSKLGVFDRNGF